MNEIGSIDERIAAAQAEIDRTTLAQTSHRSSMGKLLDKITALARPALGLGDTSAEQQLKDAEHQSALLEWRAKSWTIAQEAARADLAALLIEKAAIQHAQLIENHEDAKTVAVQTADDIGQQVEELKELLNDHRANVKECVDTAHVAGLDSLPFNRLQTLTVDWIQAQLFSSVRVSPYLDKPLGELVTDFLAHRGVESDNDEREVA